MVNTRGLELKSGANHTSELITGNSVVTLPDAWSYVVNAGMVGPGSVDAVGTSCDWVESKI